MGFSAEYGKTRFGGIEFAALGGSTYSNTVSETVACTDSENAAAIFTLSLSETSVSADGDFAQMIMSLTLAETAASGDTAAVIAAYSALLNESAGASDSCTAADMSAVPTPQTRTFTVTRENRSL